MYDKKPKVSNRAAMKPVTLADLRANPRLSLKIPDSLINSAQNAVSGVTNAVTNAWNTANNTVDNTLRDLSGLPTFGAITNAISNQDYSIDSASFGSVFDQKGKPDTISVNQVKSVNIRHIALLSHVTSINGLPPIPDNVVDPPLEILSTDIQSPITSWKSGMVGRDYVKRVLSNGQFLVLVPIELQPSKIGALANNDNAAGGGSNTIQGLLGTLESRLDVTAYGFHSKVNSLKYWNSVQAHFKTALIALGIQSMANEGSINKSLFTQYMPDDLVEKILFNNMQTVFKNVKDVPKTSQATDNKEDGKAWEIIKKVAGYVGISEETVDDIKDTAQKVTETLSQSDLATLATNAGINNLAQWVTNVDMGGDNAINSMPFTIYYCNGPVERSLSTSSELGESVVARVTTDVSQKLGKSIITNLLSKGGEVANYLKDVSADGEEYIKELSYHNGFNTQIVANTWIPKVLKSSLLNQTYTVNIRETVASSDRFSKARVQWTLCQLLPFVIPTNDPTTTLLLPRTTMYCSAFVKGVMNLPRAAITSMSVRTSPEFQTTEGIPTELDISLTIQPLYDLSAMPDFDKWYKGANGDNSYLVASMYNPQSSFNLVATMCGQNTILTKFNEGLLTFFVGGAITSVFNSIKNTGNTMSTLWRDFKSSGANTRNNIMSTVRLF